MSNNAFFDQHHDLWTAWRQDLHQHPELAFKEHRTSELVAERLSGFGIEVQRGYGGTGIVGILKTGEGPNIGLRADMDALPILEESQKAYKSATSGIMHACGHDGHTTMLLAAAQYLAETKAFSGTATFIFQPAEESEGGAGKMIEDGLFDDHPVQDIFALHNWPGLKTGEISGRVGAQMAGYDTFELTVTGLGGHAAMPHDCRDSVLAAGQLIVALQSIVSRSIDPQLPAVLSVTQIHGGDALNIIPKTVKLAGCVRYFDKNTQALLGQRIEQICSSIALQFGVSVAVQYSEVYPPTVNHRTSIEKALATASQQFGIDKVHSDQRPSMASEDFAMMLEKIPGAYLWLGNGSIEEFGALHMPTYDFNDEIIPIGAQFLSSIIEESCVN